MNNNASFSGLDFSSKPNAVPMETIEVEVGCEMFNDYAKAFLNEAMRKNPLLAERVQLSISEIEDYIKYLMIKRIECVQSSCSDYRKLKALAIPVWIQYNLAMLGEVKIRDKGIRLVPRTSFNTDMTFEQALEISRKIEMFIDDLQIVVDAMPRDIEGDHDVMMTALIAGYMRSIDRVAHPISTYVSAFMGFKLREEAAFKVLYRVQYDDIAFIASALTSRKELF